VTTPLNDAASARRKRTSERLTAGLLLVATLLIGIVLGVALDRSVLWPRMHHPPGGPVDPSSPLGVLDRNGRPRNTQRTRDRMQRELSLTDAQSARIDSIMNLRSAAFRAVRVETEQRVKAMIDTTRTMIDSVLTLDQQMKMKELRARRQAERRKGPPGDSEPPR
jgi:Spy/CpxP family protein refolding chaperone